MNRPPHDRTPSPFRLWAAVVYVLALVAVAVAIGVMSVLLAAAVSGAGVPSGWDEVGQAFGVVNGVFSVLALMIVGVTLWVQFRELRMQRDELRLQREALVRSQQELKRSAEADLRALHLDLIRMAIENSDLVVAWPELDANLPPERAQQYLYANLILQHYRMQLIVGDRSLEQVRAYVRFSFQSPIVRAYWAASEQARRAVNPAGTSTSEFDQLCDEVYREGPAAEDAP